MRSLVATGLAVLIVAHAGPVRADPGTPQLAPLHRQREDAQRLGEQLRGLDGPAAVPGAVPGTAVEPARERPAGGHDGSVVERWWFWAALGAVALTIGVAYEATRSSAPAVDGVTCDATGCRP